MAQELWGIECRIREIVRKAELLRIVCHGAADDEKQDQVLLPEGNQGKEQGSSDDRQGDDRQQPEESKENGVVQVIEKLAKVTLDPPEETKKAVAEFFVWEEDLVPTAKRIATNSGRVARSSKARHSNKQTQSSPGCRRKRRPLAPVA